MLTSRRRIGYSGEQLILEKLDQAAALQRLDEIARHNPLLRKTSEPDRIRLYEQTDGRPLVLRWVAGQLGRGSCRTLDDALRFLHCCPAGNDPLEFIFGDLLEDFSPQETQVLCALTYFTLPAEWSTSPSWQASRAGRRGRPEDPRQPFARRQPDQEERNFTLVPMVADFLRRQGPKSSRKPATGWKSAPMR